jgi:ketosteroid isomerase-like protein
LFVHEQLRTYWPKLPLAPRRRSILRMLERLLDAGVAEGRVSVDHDHRLLVAAMVGVLGQLARAAYFEELPRPTKPLAGELERLLQRVLW